MASNQRTDENGKYEVMPIISGALGNVQKMPEYKTG